MSSFTVIISDAGDHDEGFRGTALFWQLASRFGAYAELVLDHGWPERHLVFDPFMSGASLDLWGYSTPTSSQWSNGQVVFVAEAKSRVGGSDGLQGLLMALETKQRDPAAEVRSGHERKWAEIFAFAQQPRDEPLVLLLVADSARWWFRVLADGEVMHLDPSDEPIPFMS